jgi:hypothetical protein
MMPSGGPISSGPISSAPHVPLDEIRKFLHELDVALIPFANGQRWDVYLIGRAALVLQHHAPFATKDVDFVRLSAPLEAKAAELFGKNSAKAQELDFYLEFVPDGLPPLPGGFQTRSTQVNGEWQVIRPWVLEPNDLAVTKMKSFRPQDRQDLQFLCDEGVLQADKLRESMNKAWMWTTGKDGDDLRDNAFANLEKVIATSKDERAKCNVTPPARAPCSMPFHTRPPANRSPAESATCAEPRLQSRAPT